MDVLYIAVIIKLGKQVIESKFDSFPLSYNSSLVPNQA